MRMLSGPVAEISVLHTEISARELEIFVTSTFQTGYQRRNKKMDFRDTMWNVQNFQVFFRFYKQNKKFSSGLTVRLHARLIVSPISVTRLKLPIWADGKMSWLPGLPSQCQDDMKRPKTVICQASLLCFFSFITVNCWTRVNFLFSPNGPNPTTSPMVA